MFKIRKIMEVKKVLVGDLNHPKLPTIIQCQTTHLFQYPHRDPVTILPVPNGCLIEKMILAVIVSTNLQLPIEDTIVDHAGDCLMKIAVVAFFRFLIWVFLQMLEFVYVLVAVTNLEIRR